MHGLIFETSVCYWQNQPGCYLYFRVFLFFETEPLLLSPISREGDQGEMKAGIFFLKSYKKQLLCIDKQA